ncbi:MAG: hypothetical protein NVSMB49_24620 [Ktedonobacteraceae bacterium]
MNICLILDNSEIAHHRVIAGFLQTLSTTHTVRLLDVNPFLGFCRVQGTDSAIVALEEH